MDVLRALDAVIEAKAGVRRVRTPAGVRHYGQPIGSPIRPHPDLPSSPSSPLSLDAPRPTVVSNPAFSAPLSPAFKKRFEKARSALGPDPASWFDAEALSAFRKDWRSVGGSPGPKSLAVEANIRAVGKVIDGEVTRRLKAAGIPMPMTETQLKALRAKRDPLFKEWNDAKWEALDDLAREFYGNKTWKEIAGEEDVEEWQKINTLLTEKFLQRNPAMRAKKEESDRLLAKIVEDTHPFTYQLAYADTLQSVLSQLRDMGGDLIYHMALDDPPAVREDAAAGPNSGTIPFQQRYQGPPWVKRPGSGRNADILRPDRPRPVLFDRRALKDTHRLSPRQYKLVRAAIHDLEGGTADLHPKRGALEGTYSVNIEQGGRILIYPNVDGNWHVYSILPTHDYREAQRRASGPAGPDGVAVEPLPDRATREAAAAQALTEAVTRFPSSWIAASNDAKRMDIAVSEDGRGFYRHGKNPLEKARIALGNDLRETRVAVHELGHRMEHVLPWIRQVEWAFLHRRTARLEKIRRTDSPEAETAQEELNQVRRRLWDVQSQVRRAKWRPSQYGVSEELEEQYAVLKAEHRAASRKLTSLQTSTPYLTMREWPTRLNELIPGSTYKDHERVRPDQFLTSYIGKDYGDEPTSSYEVLSMGLEGIWTGSLPMHQDGDHRALILGLLASA